MWKAIRICVLMFILVTVAQGAWLARRDATNWKDPVVVALYPINADGSERAEQYVRGIDRERFQPMAEFMREQAAVYGLALNDPIELRLAPRIDRLPPQPPAGGGAVSAIVWSLSFRFWAWRHDTYTGARANVRLFLLYHDDRRSPRLPHSTGLEKGLIGLVNVFASDEMAGTDRGKDFVGIHHLGFWVDDLPQTRKQLEAHGGKYWMGEVPQAGNTFYEVKYRDPLGIVLDITDHGWGGASKDGTSKEAAPALRHADLVADRSILEKA